MHHPDHSSFIKIPADHKAALCWAADKMLQVKYEAHCRLIEFSVALNLKKEREKGMNKRPRGQ